tara:strand:+ start:798 stop:1484 length:687 start_codon:yes stop_codon:yes gene_type:complete
MKFYFDGCSFSHGYAMSEYGHDFLANRWTKLVSDHYGAEEFNLSSGGAANDTILRHFFMGEKFREHNVMKNPIRFDLNDFDLFFIQSTSPRRGEYWNRTTMKWDRYKFRGVKKEAEKRKKNPELQRWIQYWLTDIYDPKQGAVYETVMMKAITSHLKLLKKPYITLTFMNPESAVMDYDIYLNAASKHYVTEEITTKYDKLPDGHPSPLGNRQIADDIIKLIDEKVLL